MKKRSYNILNKTLFILDSNTHIPRTFKLKPYTIGSQLYFIF